MKFDKAAIGIINARKFLKSETQVDCISLQRANKTITWYGRELGIFKNGYYPLEYQYLIDHHQYSILLSDGSFFQFYYSFDDNDVLKKAKLAYYPSPVSTADSLIDLEEAAANAVDKDDEYLYEHLYNWVDLMDIHKRPPTNTSHIRFDYDKTAKSHSPSHIQFGGVQEFRVPAEFYPLPLIFIQMCLKILPAKCQGDIGNLVFEKGNCLTTTCPLDVVFLAGANLRAK